MLLFHFRVPGFQAGFIGVDIFFVLSGYFLTQIIVTALRNGRFRFSTFYLARARRTVPALGILLIVLLAIGFVVLDPVVYADLARYSVFAILFVSNFVFAQEIGYFAPTAEQQWLLHTWSLAVEWQFYILYPVYLLAAHRVGLLTRSPILTIGAPLIVSLLVGVVLAAQGGRYLTFSFFVLPSRAWEMLAGGLVWLIGTQGRPRPDPSSAASIALEIGGLALIAGSLALATSRTPWPSYHALLPVAGTFAIIWADRGERSFLRFRPFQDLGTASYSIYLWHWPIVVAGSYFAIPHEAGWVVAGLVASVGVGALSYVAVETPSRRLLAERDGLRRSAAAWGGVVAATVLPAGLVWHSDGVPERSRGDVAIARDATAATREWGFPDACLARPRDSVRPCWSGTPAAGAPAIFGDSHAQMLYPRFEGRTAPAVFVAQPGCPVLPTVSRPDRPECDDWRRRAVEYLAGPETGTIIYAANWSDYLHFGGGPASPCLRRIAECLPLSTPERVTAALEDLGREIRAFRTLGKRVLVVLPFPLHREDVAREVARATFEGRSPRLTEPDRQLEESTRALLSSMAAQGAILVDPRPLFCDGSGHCPSVDEGGRPLFRDNNHLRPAVVRARVDVLDRYLQPDP